MRKIYNLKVTRLTCEMNPGAEDLNVIDQLQANLLGRHDSFTSSTSSASTNGAPSASGSITLEPEVCSTDETPDTCAPLQQSSSSSSQLQQQSPLQGESSKGI